MKPVFAPHLNSHVLLGGRRRPVIGAPHLKLKDYLMSDLPAPPASTSYRNQAIPALRQVYMNNILGCCTISAKAHLRGLLTGNAGGPIKIFTDAEIIAMYSGACGYKPGDPSTDNGGDMQTVLNWIVQNGYPGGGPKPLGSVGIDLTNKLQVQNAVELFEGGDIGWDLPDGWINPFPSKDGDVWGVAGEPDPSNGHDTPIVDYDADGIWICTWGLLVKVTWAALAKYGARSAGGEGYILIDEAMLAKGQAKAPNGVAWHDLIVDFDKMEGSLPVPPVPVAPPAPVPAPPAPVTMNLTLLEAQLFALDLLHAHPGSFLLKSTAEKLVTDSLAKHWKP